MRFQPEPRGSGSDARQDRRAQAAGNPGNRALELQTANHQLQTVLSELAGMVAAVADQSDCGGDGISHTGSGIQSCLRLPLLKRLMQGGVIAAFASRRITACALHS